MRDLERSLERVFRSVMRLDPSIRVGGLESAASGEWDSIAHLNLILALEQEFGFTMTPEEASAATSFRAMLDLVRRKGSRTR